VHCDAARLREHFSARGEVTDAKVLRTSDGRSRQIAFIGFKTPCQAQEAVKYFSRTFLDTSRLEVEARALPASLLGSAHAHAQLAKPVGAAPDESAARPWSKHSQGSSRAIAAAAAATAAAEPAARAPTAREAKKSAAAAKENAADKARGRAAGKASAAPATEAEDAKLQEFLSLMQPRRAQRLWARHPPSQCLS
jgi:multiple RNA-binding domain-containing protein 1